MSAVLRTSWESSLDRASNSPENPPSNKDIAKSINVLEVCCFQHQEEGQPQRMSGINTTAT